MHSTLVIKFEVYFPVSPSVQTGEFKPRTGRTHPNNSPSEGLAGIQVLHNLFLGSLSGRTGKRAIQDRQNLEAANPSNWQEKQTKEDLY